jgi:hypothetical protein
MPSEIGEIELQRRQSFSWQVVTFRSDQSGCGGIFPDTHVLNENVFYVF